MGDKPGSWGGLEPLTIGLATAFMFCAGFFPFRVAEVPKTNEFGTQLRD